MSDDVSHWEAPSLHELYGRRFPLSLKQLASVCMCPCFFQKEFVLWSALVFPSLAAAVDRLLSQVHDLR